MTWSNTATREKLRVEKSHSFSLSVRVEDRLHRDIIQISDSCVFTVRSESYVVGVSDADADLTVSATQATTSRGRVFRFDIQADDLNLDSELEWFYAITYIRDGFSTVVKTGPLEIVANPLNSAHSLSYTSDTSSTFEVVTTVLDRNLLNVTNSLPVALKGDLGNGVFITSAYLGEIPENTASVPAGQIESLGREIQVGDLLFSTLSKNIVAVVTSLVYVDTVLTEVSAKTKIVLPISELLHTHFLADITDLEGLVLSDDIRLSDARTPLAHKNSHKTGGSDALTAADVGAAPATHSHHDLYYTEDEADARFLQRTTAQLINAQSGISYTLVAADVGKMVTFTNSSPITVTVPSGTFAAGQSVNGSVRGSGMVTLVGSGVTLRPEAGLSLKTRGQYSGFTIFFISSTEADVYGSLATA